MIGARMARGDSAEPAGERFADSRTMTDRPRIGGMAATLEIELLHVSVNL
jgi:hypothetical protein